MCTSIISNRKKTIVGWNLDILGMEHRISASDTGVFIEILDSAEGWLPLFGANARGDFVGMPTCWPYDDRSDPNGAGENVLMLDIELLTMKKSFSDVKDIAETLPVYSAPGVTFMSSLSDRNGNVLHIVPGQGCRYFEKPVFSVLTNFSPFKSESVYHPWMGRDRYETAVSLLAAASEDFDVKDCFDILKAVSQEICPTVVSMVFDVTEMKVYWCENRCWDMICERKLTAASCG